MESSDLAAGHAAPIHELLKGSGSLIVRAQAIRLRCREEARLAEVG